MVKMVYDFLGWEVDIGRKRKKRKSGKDGGGIKEGGERLERRLFLDVYLRWVF